MINTNYTSLPDIISTPRIEITMKTKRLPSFISYYILSYYEPKTDLYELMLENMLPF
jgi:hypothetical protein